MTRKQFIKKGLILGGAILTSAFVFRKQKVPVVKNYTSNPNLKTINPKWKGTPLDQDGLFINHEFPWLPDYRSAMKFMFGRNPQRDEKKRDTWNITVVKDESWLNDSSDKIVWLGHACFFIQLSGIRILIDPVFWNLPIGKRYSELPLAPEKLLNIDYILVSHAHYDHCDKDSLKLLAQNNPHVHILTGLKLDEVIAKWTDRTIHTAGWYQQYNLKHNITITFVPARHWANRSLLDVNTSLWGGFMIENTNKRIYYGGDSGYGSHFQDMGDLFAGIDVALIGAGAYAPKWFMSPNHQNPYDSVRAFHDTKAKTLVPFHYGTFDAADEPMSEPEKILRKLDAEGKISNTLNILKLGECFYL